MVYFKQKRLGVNRVTQSAGNRFCQLMVLLVCSFVSYSSSIVAQEEKTDPQKTEQSASPAGIPEQTSEQRLESLKQEVLAVNRDLFILEEDLLFPASTQMAVYFSLDVGYFFKLDHIKVKIDDEQVNHYLYTEKDVSALNRGAVQKLYLGNIGTGDHELVAVLNGIGPHKRKYRRAVSFKFNKSSDAVALEIKLHDDTGKMQPSLEVVEWTE